jgi:choline-sulfatase
MSTQPNILLIMSDQHNPQVVGYRGHPYVQTPHIDQLARDGAHFTRAYCTNPICTPSRMSMITGQYSHRIGVPNNGFPLDRAIMTWPRRLDQAGVETTMLGKLDLCGEYQDAGFTNHKIIRRRPVHPAMSAEPPFHLQAPFKERMPDAFRSWRPVNRALRHAGPRTSQILCREKFITNEVDGENDDFIGNYDHDIIVTDWAVNYLREKGSIARTNQSSQPWALYVGLILPHEPFTIPAEYFDRYYPDNLALPVDARFPNPDLHPALQFLQQAHGTGTPTEDDLRRTIAAYYGMVTCVDDQVGRIMEELDNQGLAENTVVIYTSDHGESLGDHGLFFKKCSYEGSVGIPVVMRGPGIPSGARIDVPVDLTDLYPTMLDCAGINNEPELPGSSWLPLVSGGEASRDYAFAEYHGYFVNRDWFMIVYNNLKYTWYSNGEPSTLFDLTADPHELHNVVDDPAYAAGLQACHERLLAVCDPIEESRRAKALQGLIGPNGEDYTETTLKADM